MGSCINLRFTISFFPLNVFIVSPTFLSGFYVTINNLIVISTHCLILSGSHTYVEIQAGKQLRKKSSAIGSSAGIEREPQNHNRFTLNLIFYHFILSSFRHDVVVRLKTNSCILFVLRNVSPRYPLSSMYPKNPRYSLITHKQLLPNLSTQLISNKNYYSWNVQERLWIKTIVP